MPRIAFVLALLLAAAPAAAQTDRYRPAQPPTDKRAAAGGIPSSPRLSLGSVEKGDRAPDFDLPLAGGGKVRLSNLRGQWAVVCFARAARWARSTRWPVRCRSRPSCWASWPRR